VLAIVNVGEISLFAVAAPRRFVAALIAIVGCAEAAFNRARGLFAAWFGRRDRALLLWTWMLLLSAG
jgi:hypothetical protein